jgi:hypothetical protein
MGRFRERLKKTLRSGHAQLPDLQPD